MRLLCSALLSANLLLGSSFSLLSPYHFCVRTIFSQKTFFPLREPLFFPRHRRNPLRRLIRLTFSICLPRAFFSWKHLPERFCMKKFPYSPPPCKYHEIMTLILIFDAIESGQISLEDTVTVSEYAASMGGSQVFLEPNETQTVDTMIKCISIASANDACVAMAEFICGSEAAFVEK